MAACTLPVNRDADRVTATAVAFGDRVIGLFLIVFVEWVYAFEQRLRKVWQGVCQGIEGGWFGRFRAGVDFYRRVIADEAGEG
ncbi:hypothetical protein GCM10007392_22210 [Saccharospirillum salsuginis]|uniref:Uncharacterized protein n=1 Tax=Saccharospirillum salsuginis TaxID=418750 RepID=A0A918KAQ0_9GAMM|nr:hypothetical protein GCM10007392_22210 [Saccharospirillum salsuginis]